MELFFDHAFNIQSIHGNVNMPQFSFKDNHFMETDVDDDMIHKLRLNWDYCSYLHPSYHNEDDPLNDLIADTRIDSM